MLSQRRLTPLFACTGHNNQYTSYYVRVYYNIMSIIIICISRISSLRFYVGTYHTMVVGSRYLYYDARTTKLVLYILTSDIIIMYVLCTYIYIYIIIIYIIGTYSYILYMVETEIEMEKHTQV